MFAKSNRWADPGYPDSIGTPPSQAPRTPSHKSFPRQLYGPTVGLLENPKTIGSNGWTEINNLFQRAEQQRIADCLSSLDARIAAESEKLDSLKTHKKGLMQQLFPSAEGV